MPQLRIVDESIASQTSLKGNNIFVTEASTLGLSVGEWPMTLASSLGNMQPFQHYLETTDAHIYRQLGSSLWLHVLND